jgi:hypothetical protein
MRIILNKPEDIERAIELIRATPDGYMVEIMPYVRKRSRNQNNTLHMWDKVICDFLGEVKDFAKNVAKINLRYFRKLSYKGNEYIIPKSSAEMTVEECTNLMMEMEVIAVDNGIKLPYPDDYNLLMGR